MTGIHIRRFLPLLIPGLLVLLHACTDAWEDHYGEDSMDLPNYNLFGYIEANPELNVFEQMLVSSGYDSLISASQTFTVWAPSDQALGSIDQGDPELVSEIVRNHIARGNHPASGIESRQIKMLNGKNISFSRESDGFVFGKVNLLESNQLTRNGQVHMLEGYVAYLNNLWEFIGRTEGLDSLAGFLYGQNQWIFDPSSSLEIGIDTGGNVIYDSVFIYSNPVLGDLGALGTEDSVYTAILPDNAAWTEAYGRIEPYFNVPDVYGGVLRKRLFTRRAIVQDMVFRERVWDPGSRGFLVSTVGNVFYNPAYLFPAAPPVELSNGNAYVTDLMAFTDTSSWFKPIRVEAESNEGRDNANSNIYERSGLGTGLDISDDNYIVVDPTGISDIAQPNVRFSIPNTLSASYDIYCVFAPSSIVDTSNLRTGRVTYQLTYISTATGRTRRQTVTPEDNLIDPEGLTKMLVTRFDFEFANVIDEDYKETAVRLQVNNNVTVNEESTGAFTRTMRIDCIVLEPAVE